MSIEGFELGVHVLLLVFRIKVVMEPFSILMISGSESYLSNVFALLQIVVRN